MDFSSKISPGSDRSKDLFRSFFFIPACQCQNDTQQNTDQLPVHGQFLITSDTQTLVPRTMKTGLRCGLDLARHVLRLSTALVHMRCFKRAGLMQAVCPRKTHTYLFSCPLLDNVLIPLSHLCCKHQALTKVTATFRTNKSPSLCHMVIYNLWLSRCWTLSKYTVCLNLYIR